MAAVVQPHAQLAERCRLFGVSWRVGQVRCENVAACPRPGKRLSCTKCGLGEAQATALGRVD